VIVEKRADGKVETEATIKIWVGGERFVRTAEGNGPVNALDGAARRDRRDLPAPRDIELVNFKVRILDETKGTGAVTRVLLDASDGHGVWGTIGVSRTSSRRPGRRSSTRSSTACSRAASARGKASATPAAASPAGTARRRGQSGDNPARAPVLGEAEEQAVIEVLRSGSCRWARFLPEFERLFAERLGAPHGAR
jgi:hypothetical protein